jgi:hypothetical protein
MTTSKPRPTTTDAGIPVASQEHSLTVGPDGPILLNDFYLIEQMANFNRERIPERQPHAKGSGAFGHFEVTNDVSQFTQAAVFQPGIRTETLIRFSTVAGERGSAACPDVQLAEPPEVPFHVVQVEAAGLVDSKPDLGHQTVVRQGGCGREVAPHASINQRSVRFAPLISGTMRSRDRRVSDR